MICPKFNARFGADGGAFPSSPVSKKGLKQLLDKAGFHEFCLMRIGCFEVKKLQLRLNCAWQGRQT
jgi:hypothetical protein